MYTPRRTSVHQLAEFRAALEALFTLAVTTGMRQGELLALRWRDVDWSARRLVVHHTLIRLDGRW